MRHLILSICLFGLVFHLGCQKQNEETVPRKTPAAANTAAEVVVAPVTRGSIYKTYTSVGTVTPKDSTRIFPKVGGRISEVFVEEGDIVSEGQRLLQIDTFDYSQAVENATALRNQASANLKKARRDFRRIEQLYRDNAVSKQKLQDMKTALELAEFSYDQAAAALKKAKEDLKECSVRAPISGMVTTKAVNPGELVSPQMMAFVLMQMEIVEVEVELPEEAFGYLDIGKKGFVSFDAIPDNTVTGTITKIYPTIDPVSRTVKVTLSVENPGLQIRSGMTARSRIIQMARPDVLHGPKTALIPEEDRYVVYRINSEHVEKTLVAVGIIGDTVFEVKSGLSEGDRLVVKGVTGLRNGMRVTVISRDPEEKQED